MNKVGEGIVSMLEKEEGFPYSPTLNRAIKCVEGTIIFPDIFASLETKKKISWPAECIHNKYYLTHQEYMKAINSFSHKKIKNLDKVPRKRHPLKPFICYEIGKHKFPARVLLGDIYDHSIIDFTLLCSKEKLIKIIRKIIEEKG